MATIIFAKKKNPRNDSSIDLDENHNRRKETHILFGFAEGEITAVKAVKNRILTTSPSAKSGQAKKSARGMPWH